MEKVHYFNNEQKFFCKGKWLFLFCFLENQKKSNKNCQLNDSVLTHFHSYSLTYVNKISQHVNLGKLLNLVSF